MNYSLFSFGEAKNTTTLTASLNRTLEDIQELTESLTKAVSNKDFAGIANVSFDLLVLSVKADILAPLVKYLNYDDVAKNLNDNDSYYEVLLNYFIYELNMVHNPTSGSTSKLENDKLEIKRAYLTNSLSNMHQNKMFSSNN